MVGIKLGGMKAKELVVVAEYHSLVEAEMARSILACAGIQSYIEDEFMTAMHPSPVRSRLLVSEDNYDEAKTLLRIRE